MYSYIINPITNQKVNISSNLAKNIIKKYIKNLNGGAGNKTITVEWAHIQKPNWSCFTMESPPRLRATPTLMYTMDSGVFEKNFRSSVSTS